MTVNMDKYDKTTETGYWNHIVASTPVPEWELTIRRAKRAGYPGRVNIGGHLALSSNDPATLADLFNRHAHQGGTAHPVRIPGTVGSDGKIITVNF